MAERFTFSGLSEVFAKANEEKSGDRLAGIAARSEQERIAAKCVLADLPLRDIIARPLIPPEADEVSRLLQEAWDEAAFQPVSSLTVGEFREYLLDDSTTDSSIKALRWGITPEIAAAVAKLMSNRCRKAGRRQSDGVAEAVDSHDADRGTGAGCPSQNRKRAGRGGNTEARHRDRQRDRCRAGDRSRGPGDGHGIGSRCCRTTGGKSKRARGAGDGRAEGRGHPCRAPRRRKRNTAAGPVAPRHVDGAGRA